MQAQVQRQVYDPTPDERAAVAKVDRSFKLIGLGMLALIGMEAMPLVKVAVSGLMH